MEADAEVWRDRVQRWKQSGLTAKAFAELEGRQPRYCVIHPHFLLGSTPWAEVSEIGAS